MHENPHERVFLTPLCYRSGPFVTSGRVLEIWFGRARGRCETCSRRHFDRLRVTRVILAAAHLDHDPMNSAPSNLKSLCQRCHMLHDRPYHLAQRWLTYRMRWAIGDLFLGRYVRG